MAFKKQYYVIYRIPTPDGNYRTCVLESMARNERQAKKQAATYLRKVCTDAEVIKAEEVKKIETK
jgi:hypothetical protein